MFTLNHFMQQEKTFNIQYAADCHHQKSPTREPKGKRNMENLRVSQPKVEIISNFCMFCGRLLEIEENKQTLLKP